MQAPFEILIEVALDGASGDIGIGGDPVMSQSVALEPDDFDLALDARFGVVESVMGQGSAVVRGEDDSTHAKPNRCRVQAAPRQ